MAQSLCSSISSATNRLDELVNTYTACKTMSGIEQVLAIIIRKQCVIPFSKAINMFTKFLATKMYRLHSNLFINSYLQWRNKNVSIELVFEVTYSKEDNTMELFYT